MSFLPGSLTPALLRSCHRKVISHSDGHSVVGCRKNKKSRSHRASEIGGSKTLASKWCSMYSALKIQSRVLLFSCSRQQNQRRGGAVRHFRCTDTVSDETDLWWNIGIQLFMQRITVVPPLYRYITCSSRFWMSLTIFGISKSRFQRKRKKIPLLVRTFRSDLSTGFGKLSSYTSRKNSWFRTLCKRFPFKW